MRCRQLISVQATSLRQTSGGWLGMPNETAQVPRILSLERTPRRYPLVRGHVDGDEVGQRVAGSGLGADGLVSHDFETHCRVVQTPVTVEQRACGDRDRRSHRNSGVKVLRNDG